MLTRQTASKLKISPCCLLPRTSQQQPLSPKPTHLSENDVGRNDVQSSNPDAWLVHLFRDDFVPSLANSPSANAEMLFASPNTAIAPAADSDLKIIVMKKRTEFIATVMYGMIAAIEGKAGASPEVALRLLLETTCELLVEFKIGEVGDHHLNLRGGGVYNGDLFKAVKDA